METGGPVNYGPVDGEQRRRMGSWCTMQSDGPVNSEEGDGWAGGWLDDADGWAGGRLLVLCS